MTEPELLQISNTTNEERRYKVTMRGDDVRGSIRYDALVVLIRAKQNGVLKVVSCESCDDVKKAILTQDV